MAASPFSAVPRSIRIALLIALALFIFTRGVLPAWSRILSDFPNYFTAARIVVAGDRVERLYDDAWFQQQIRAQGIDSLGQFTPFPPPTALLLMPLTSLAPLQAQRVVTLVSILALAAAILLLARVLAWSTLDAAVFVLLAGIGISNGMRLGQPYILMATLCIAGYYAWQRGRPLLAGALLGLFVPIKYYPILIVLCLGALRQWRVLL